MVKFGGGLDAGKLVRLLIIGAIVMFAVSKIIDLNVIGDGTCSGTDATKDYAGCKNNKDCCENLDGTWIGADLFRSDVEYSGKCSGVANADNYQDSKSCEGAKGIWTRGLIGNIYVWILVAIAVILAWNLGIGGGKMTRKYMVSLIIAGVILYFVYNHILAPNLGLDTIEFAAYQLQSILAP